MNCLIFGIKELVFFDVFGIILVLFCLFGSERGEDGERRVVYRVCFILVGMISA